MKRFLLRLLGIALTLCVFACVLTPVGVRQYRLWRDAQIADAYRQAAEQADGEALLRRAQRYNRALRRTVLWDPFSGEAPVRDDSAVLDVTGNGVMAVLRIPKLAVTLPVYTGTRQAALGAGVGHLEGSALPVSGTDGGLSVLAARRGRFFAGPFAALERMLPGDCFYIESLGNTLTYEVTQVLTVLPEALAAQDVADGSDECILMTTPANGSDSHRLLVRGTRVSRRDATLRDDSQTLPGWPTRLVFAAPVFVACLALTLLVESVRRAVRKRRAKKRRL